ncbi:hypothetical protein [Marixanthomonas spongiae]|uniref:Uncharacterized protein n=1 Tax=Marixanthomonas spongiae TaxID=2174845 RepID=A0A2U0I521_9FLAO|nr:hypothetical protein [Marixanthomonas spongiae]PVW16199.1 hypothetical protein DDV96_02700 [Marixanthomonas spongiae]
MKNFVTENLDENDIIFIVNIGSDSKYFGLEGMIKIRRKLPTTVEIIVSQMGSNISKIICRTQNKSDLQFISENLLVEVIKV